MTAGRFDSGLRVIRSAVIDRRYRNLAVRVLGGKESAFLRRHVTPDIIKDVSRYFFEKRFACNLKSLEVSHRELRLVIKHFFEMRHVPEGIDRVAVKTTTHMIVHSS